MRPVRKSGCGTVAAKAFVVSMPAAINVPSGVKKKSSLPSPLHRGARPPSREIGNCPSCTGNGRTYTWLRPDAFDSYAIQRPSGENVPLASSYAVCRKTDFVRSPESGNVHKSYAGRRNLLTVHEKAAVGRPIRGRNQCFRFHQQLIPAAAIGRTDEQTVGRPQRVQSGGVERDVLSVG